MSEVTLFAIGYRAYSFLRCSVERLMGTKPEARFDFIQERAEFASDELLDV